MRFLGRLKELRPLAKKKLGEAHARYQATFDHSVREKDKEFQAGSWAYERKEFHATGTNPKLYAQVDGPYRVLETDGLTFQIQQGEQKGQSFIRPYQPGPYSFGIKSPWDVDNVQLESGYRLRRCERQRRGPSCRKP
jgi:hypothetical protein